MARKTSIDIYHNALQELKSGKVKPVYFLCGSEDFFLDKLQEAAQGLVPDDQKDFNFDLLYGQDVTVDRILDIARSYPMMAERRVLIVREFQALSKTTVLTNDDGGGSSLDEFIPYFENPNPNTLLVLIDNKKPNGRTKLGKTIKKSKHVGYYEFKEVPDYKLPDWIIEWAHSQYKKDIDPVAAEMLAQYVGNNLLLLSTEIDKLCTFKDTSDTIREEDIKKIIGLYREYSAFELKDAVISRNLDQALFISEQMLQLSKTDTGEVIKTVGLFYNVFSNIWQIRRLSQQGMRKPDIQDAMGIGNNWYFNKLWQDASKFRLHEIPRIFEAILDADRAIKGFGQMDPASVLFLMIKRIIHG